MPWLIGLGAAALMLYFAIQYNRLVRARNMMREAWSGIDVQLKRRSALIPNLVETVRGYSSHEQSLFEEVARQRAAAVQARGTQEKGVAENALSGCIKSLFALAEAYPQLRASDNYLDLQEQLVQAEDQLQLARRYYNGSVRILNNRVESFPGNIVAALFGFASEEYFTLELATERQAPQLDWED